MTVSNTSRLIVVVDGGGSKCRVAISDLEGKILAKYTGGAANITTDFEQAVTTIIDTVDRAYKLIGLQYNRSLKDYIYLGLAGGRTKDAVIGLKNKLYFADIAIESDRKISVHGALGNGNGVVASIGTGSFFVKRLNGQQTKIGGWGSLLGDEASGSYLGRKLLTYTIHAYDGIIEHSDLTKNILNQFDGTPRGMIKFAQTKSPADFGGFTHELHEAMLTGDPIAILIFKEGVDWLERVLTTLDTKGCGKLYLLGGLASIYQSMLSKEFKALCKQPKLSGVESAIDLAKQKWHPLSM